MDEDKIVEWCARFLGGLIIAVVIFLLCMMCSCTRTIYVPQTTIQRDSIYITQVHKDSIYLHDSIYQFVKADTVYIQKWRTKYVERLRIDTLYSEKVDSIRVPYPVEKPLSFAQMAWIRLGKAFVWVGSIVVLGLILGAFIKR